MRIRSFAMGVLAGLILVLCWAPLMAQPQSSEPLRPAEPVTVTESTVTQFQVFYTDDLAVLLMYTPAELAERLSFPPTKGPDHCRECKPLTLLNVTAGQERVEVLVLWFSREDGRALDFKGFISPGTSLTHWVPSAHVPDARGLRVVWRFPDRPESLFFWEYRSR